MKKLDIIFMGTPDFAVGCLKRLVEENYSIKAVVTTPDRPAGRGRKLRASAVKAYAEEQGLDILQPENLKDSEFLTNLEEYKADLFIVVAFRMLPREVFAMPPKGTFNLHASLLPKYRGAAPINWAIINDEKETGVTTFFLDDNIDTGKILLAESTPISEDETVGSLHDRLLEIGSELILKTVDKIENESITARAQADMEGITYAPKLTASNTKIDWTKPGREIELLIRGLSPYPSSWSNMSNNEEDLKVKIYFAKFVNQKHQDKIGAIKATKDSIIVSVTDGYIEISDIQLPGRRRMKTKDLLNGYTFSESAKMF